MNEFQRIFRSEVFKQYAAIVTVLAVAAFWLASCSPFPGEKPSVGDGGGTPTLPLPDTETPTATATSTETPTATITPTPTEIPFSPETWAGTDANRIEFNKNMTEWKVDPASYTCDEAGICKDAAGVEFFNATTGNYEFNWLQPVLANSGILGGPQTAPDPNSGLRKNASNDLAMDYIVPLIHTFRTISVEKLGTDPLVDDKIGAIFPILLDTENNYWGVAAGYRVYGVPQYKYLIYTNNLNEVESIMINPVNNMQVLNYWAIING